MTTLQQKASPRLTSGSNAVFALKSIPMLTALVAALAFAFSGLPKANAGLVYEQAHNGTGTVYHSAWVPPDGTVYDEYLWDNFTLANNQAITEIRWRGGHDSAYAYLGTTLQSFRIRIYASIAGGSQPDVVSTPLCNYQSSGTCGETLAGVFGSTTLNDYRFTLPSPFQAAAGTRYWLQITANETGIPNWGFAAANGGNGAHFRKLEYQYQNISGDTAFSLYVSDAATAQITASVDPAGTGSVSGAGNYPVGANATLTATPAAGYGFVNWTVNGTQVSTSAKYTFAVSANRALVAHFVPSCVITTNRSPVNGGHSSAGGTYNTGAQVTVTATPNKGFTFGGWYEWGATQVSISPSYTFTASQDMLLVAQFDPLPATAVFDFDNASPGQGMPGTQSASGLTATFSATSGNWYVTNTIYYWVPLDFSGNFLSPTGFPSAAAKLQITFDHPLTDVKIDFVTAELAADYDTAPLVRITAYQGSIAKPPVGSASARGAWLSGSYPEGSVGFSSATPFDVITIDIPTSQGYPVSNLLFLDNLIAVQAMVAITAAASPPEGGSVTGTGSYPLSIDVTLSACPNPGFIFLNWTENGTPVSALPDYTFTATANRGLVANFAPGATIQATIAPSGGGTISGGGPYLMNTPVTLTATPDAGYRFVNWTENGVELSTDPNLSFIATADRNVEANFALIIPQLQTSSSTAGQMVIAWPSDLPGWVLETSPDLSPGSWTPSALPVNVNGTNCEVTVPVIGGSAFYRLTHP